MLVLNSEDFLGGGNTNAVLPDRSIVYGIGKGVVRIRPTRPQLDSQTSTTPKGAV
jgi:hypothetical protein